MANQVLGIGVNFVVTGLLGYVVATLKNYKGKLKAKEVNETLQNEALKTLLQTQLTNIYFVFADRQEIPDYMYKNWLNLFKIYKSLGGNDYIDQIKHKMENWSIVNTDILNKN